MTVEDLIRQLRAFSPDLDALVVDPSTGEQFEIGSVWKGSREDDDDELTIVEITLAN